LRLPTVFGWIRKLRHAMRIAWLRHRLGVRIGKNCKIHPTVIFQLGHRDSISIGDDVEIWPGVILAPYGGSIEIGNRVYIGPYSILYGQGGLRVGNNTLIAPHVVLVPSNHVFDRIDIPIRDQGLRNVGIEIGEDCWLGARVTVLDGVRIGKGCVIGADSTVTRPLPDWCKAKGRPAEVTGKRGDPPRSAAGESQPTEADHGGT